MKRLLPMLLFFLPFAAISQKINTDTLRFEYIGVDQVDSVSAKMLQSRAKLFVAENFKSARDVTQLDDADAGVILVKGSVVPIIKAPLLGRMGYGYVRFAMKLQFKDGKYRYTLTDFTHVGSGDNIRDGGDLTRPKPICGTFLMSKDYWHQVKASANQEILALIDHLQRQMHSSELSSKKDDTF